MLDALVKPSYLADPCEFLFVPQVALIHALTDHASIAPWISSHLSRPDGCASCFCRKILPFSNDLFTSHMAVPVDALARSFCPFGWIFHGFLLPRFVGVYARCLAGSCCRFPFIFISLHSFSRLLCRIH